MPNLVRATDSSATAGELLALADGEIQRHPGYSLGLFEWRGGVYPARYLRPYEQKPYIVAIIKVAPPVSPQKATAIRKTRDIPILKIHPRVEFEGPRYLLGLTGDTLLMLSGEDIVYCHVHPLDEAEAAFAVGGEQIDFDNP